MQKPWTIEQRPEVEVAYLLAKTYWGQGLGTEAAQAILHYGFQQLHLSRLICLIDPGNQASSKVARKIGMTLEKELELDGEPTLIYSIHKHGWDQSATTRIGHLPCLPFKYSAR